MLRVSGEQLMDFFRQNAEKMELRSIINYEYEQKRLYYVASIGQDLTYQTIWQKSIIFYTNIFLVRFWVSNEPPMGEDILR